MTPDCIEDRARECALLECEEILVEIFITESALVRFLVEVLGRKRCAEIPRGPSLRDTVHAAIQFCDRHKFLDVGFFQHLGRVSPQWWEKLREIAHHLNVIIPAVPPSLPLPLSRKDLRRVQYPMLAAATSLVVVLSVAFAAQDSPGKIEFILAAALFGPIALYAVLTRQTGPFYSSLIAAFFVLRQGRADLSEHHESAHRHDGMYLKVRALALIGSLVSATCGATHHFLSDEEAVANPRQ